MSEQNTTNNTTVVELRQAENNVDLAGSLKRLELEVKKEADNAITGRFIIATAADCEHQIKVYVKPTDFNGQPSRAYAGMNTWLRSADESGKALQAGVHPKDMEAYFAQNKVCDGLTPTLSYTALKKAGYDDDTAAQYATQVYMPRKFTALAANEYFTDDGELVSRAEINGRFFSHAKERIEHPRADFAVEMFIKNIAPEIKDSVPTGRLIVTGITPLSHGRLSIVEYIVPADLADGFENNYERHQTALFRGQIVNRITREVKTHAHWGNPVDEASSSFVRELLLTNGDPAYGEESTKAYSVEQIQQAMTVRENVTLPDMLARKKSRASGTQAQGFNNSATAANAARAVGFGAQAAPTPAPASRFAPPAAPAPAPAPAMPAGGVPRAW